MSYFRDCNSGYDGWSMSKNASAAYECGEKPLSKWTKSEILSLIEDDYPETAKKLESVKRDVLRNHLLSYSGYHHTSSYFNSTDFYEIDFDVIEDLTDEEIEEWKNEVVEVEKPVSIKYRGSIHYLEWGGSRKHPKAFDRYIEDVNIERKGCFYIVTDDYGFEIIRKKIGSNGTYIYDYKLVN